MSELTNLRNRFNGETLFIVGNGPSLTPSSLDKISDECSLALNKINYIYKDTKWRPSFYLYIQSSMSDTEEEFIRENISLDIPCFINESFSDTFGNQENVYYITRRKLPADPFTTAVQETGKSKEEITVKDARKYWEDDICEGVYKYHSVLPQFQIASYLGFDKIYLIGFDLGFEVQRPHMIFDSGLDPLNYYDRRKFIEKAKSDQIILISLINGLAYKVISKLLSSDFINNILSRTTNLHEDNHHFSSEYEYEISMRDRNTEHIHAHKLVQKITNEKNIQVFNATNGGELEVYPRKDLEDIL